MLRHRILWPVAAIALVWSTSLTAAEPPRGVTLAYVSQGRVYSLARAITSDPPISGTPFGTVLYLAHRPLVAGKGAKAEGRVDEIHDFGFPSVAMRWRVHGGHLFESGSGSPCPDVRQVSLARLDTLWDSNEANVRTDTGSGLQLNAGLLEGVDWYAHPVEKVMDDVEEELKAEVVRPLRNLTTIRAMVDARVCYDMLPGKKGEAKLFWTHKGFLYEAAGTNRLVKDEYVTKWGEPVKSRAPFAGQFHVFPAGKGYLFVTASGTPYHMADPAKGNGRAVTKLAALGRDADLVLHDEASGKTFAFALPRKTKDGTSDGSYVELAPKQKPRAFAAKLVRKLDPKKPMDAAWDCARLLLADKCISGK